MEVTCFTCFSCCSSPFLSPSPLPFRFLLYLLAYRLQFDILFVRSDLSLKSSRSRVGIGVWREMDLPHAKEFCQTRNPTPSTRILSDTASVCHYRESRRHLFPLTHTAHTTLHRIIPSAAFPALSHRGGYQRPYRPLSTIPNLISTNSYVNYSNTRWPERSLMTESMSG